METGFKDMSSHLGWGADPPANMSKGHKIKHQKMGMKKTIEPQKKGQKPISFKQGGLHKTLGVKAGEKIPQAKFNAALAGKEGKAAKKKALFAKDVLHHK